MSGKAAILTLLFAVAPTLAAIPQERDAAVRTASGSASTAADTLSAVDLPLESSAGAERGLRFRRRRYPGSRSDSSSGSESGSTDEGDDSEGGKGSGTGGTGGGSGSGGEDSDDEIVVCTNQTTVTEVAIENNADIHADASALSPLSFMVSPAGMMQVQVLKGYLARFAHFPYALHNALLCQRLVWCSCEG